MMKRKRILSTILALVLFLNMIPPVSAEETDSGKLTMTASETSVNHGDVVTVTITANPDFESQISILRDRHTENPLNRISPVVNLEQLQEMIREANEVEVQDSVYEYVTRLTQATREHPLIQLGVSPRGALAVCRMAKAYAYLNGRDFVIPEDVAAVFGDVCCHRLVLATKARMMEEKPENLIRSILESVKMPVLKK